MKSTLEDQAVVGRRIELALYRDKDNYLPGIITAVNTEGAYFWVRLDGKRSNLPVRTDHEYLRYLDEVVDVPALPMGPFTPVADDMNGFYEKAGVLVAAIGEDGEDLIVVTDDLDKARASVAAYAEWTGLDPDYVGLDDLRPHWAVFTWEPEDAEFPWTVRWDAEESDDQAIRIHYLPAS
jgi:hypothetical protein